MTCFYDFHYTYRLFRFIVYKGVNNWFASTGGDESSFKCRSKASVKPIASISLSIDATGIEYLVDGDAGVDGIVFLLVDDASATFSVFIFTPMPTPTPLSTDSSLISSNNDTSLAKKTDVKKKEKGKDV